jgi:hypothetical protein
MTPLSRFLLWTLVLLTLVRATVAGLMELTPEECYLRLLAERGVWLGMDGGGLAHVLAGWGHSSFGVRWAAPLLGLLTSWGLFRCVDRLAGERTAAWSVVILNLLPAFNLGCVMLQPAWFAAGAWVMAIQLIWTALHRANPWDWRWWLAGGFAVLALWCDLSSFWIPFPLFFLFSISRRWRKRLLRPGPWIVLGMWALLGFLPLAWWNHTHAGALVDGWLQRMDWAHTRWFRFDAMADGLLQLTLGFSPLLIIALGWALFQVTRTRPREDASYFLLAQTLPVLALWFVSLSFGFGHSDWLIPAIPACCALMATVWQPSGLLRERRSRWQWSGLAVAALISLLVIYPDFLRRAGWELSYERDSSRHRQGWTETATEAAALIREASQEFPEGLLVIAETPQLAAALEFYLPTDVPVFRTNADAPNIQVMESPFPTSQYAFWPRYDETPPPGTGQSESSLGKTALFFTDANHRSGPPALIQASFTSVEPLMVYEVSRFGFTIRRIKVFVCYDYEGAPL